MQAAETPQSLQVDAAATGEFSPLKLGLLSLWPPVILAPMAGVTDIPFRRVCRRFGAPLCESEMVAARPLVEGNAKTWDLAAFGADETPKSIQLYAAEPDFIGRAVELLIGTTGVDHVDLNFGCSVPKVTRQGGGAALPHRPTLVAKILSNAVKAAGDVPVTAKFRLGLTDEYLNFLETGRIAQECGCAAVTLHARTAAQFYDGQARWSAIAELKARLDIPVIGNGDIWEAADALRMMRDTGCDAVAVGRGCLGRPWLFDDLVRVFSGVRPQPPPRLGVVAQLMREHLSLLIASVGEARAIPCFRRQATWYTKGYRGSTQLREAMVLAKDLEQFEHILSEIDPDLELPVAVLRAPRAKNSRQKALCLPDGYLEDPQRFRMPRDADGADGG